MNRNGKINIKMIGGLFLIALLLFTFFSKTVYTYNLPTVTAVLPVNGKLNKLETTTGIVDWEQVEEIYAEVGGKVDEILVSEGESVKKGQPLIHLSYDEDDIQTKLKELDISRNKLLIDIETIQSKSNKINRDLAELEKETYDKDTVSDYELTALKDKMTKKEHDYQKEKKLKEEEYRNAVILYDAGTLTKHEMENKTRELENLTTDYDYDMQSLNSELDELQKTIEEKEKKSSESLEEKEKTRRTKRQEDQHELLTLQQDLKRKNFDLSDLAITEEGYRKILSDYSSNMVIHAPSDATIISLPFKKGQFINEKQMMVSLGLGGEFKIECDVPLENNFITAGDICELNNSSHTLEGVVSKITPEENGKKITVTLVSDEVSTGETFELTFEKESADSYIIVPNGAINKDNDGYFVYQIKRRDGILGKEFYAQKLSVYLGDSDNENTVISKGITFFEPLALLSDKPFSADNTVKIKNEGDFFAD